MLEVEQLSLQLGNAQIFADVTLSVAGGEIVALVGPNGAGKTSLLKTLLGIYQPLSGDARFNGASLFQLSAERRAHALSYVPQRQEQALGFTVAEFIEMALYAQNFRYGFSAEATSRVDQALEQVEMKSFRERNIQTLSGGELQKIYLAGALAQRAQIALLDEPTSFLDPAHQFEVSDILARSVHQKHADGSAALSAALIVTHDVNLALALADRVMAMKSGQLIFSGAVADFADEKLLAELYGVELRLSSDEISGKPFLLPPLAQPGAASQPSRRP